jgi:uracil-DNA glycosylase
MEWKHFEEKLGTWAPKIKPFFNSGGFDPIYSFLKEEGRRGKVILPSSHSTYQVFNEVKYSNLKIVFILQDPYPYIKNKIPVSCGVAMDCRNTGILQPSLELFYNGMQDNLYKGVKMIRDPSLQYLSKQGIMMLNTSLTVELNKPSSHKDIWKDFTKYLFEEVFTQYNSGLIFVMCGKQSQYFERYINPLQHYIISLEHPAAAAHKNREWEHKTVFSTINHIMKSNNGYMPMWDFNENELPF